MSANGTWSTTPCDLVANASCPANQIGEIDANLSTLLSSQVQGMVGPGVRHSGQDDVTWADHVDARPTLMTLVGLKDDYHEDGRVLLAVVEDRALPASPIDVNRALKDVVDAEDLLGQTNALAAIAATP